jgi:hypothetical protein
MEMSKGVLWLVKRVSSHLSNSSKSDVFGVLRSRFPILNILLTSCFDSQQFIIVRFFNVLKSFIILRNLVFILSLTFLRRWGSNSILISVNGYTRKRTNFLNNFFMKYLVFKSISSVIFKLSIVSFCFWASICSIEYIKRSCSGVEKLNINL